MSPVISCIVIFSLITSLLVIIRYLITIKNNVWLKIRLIVEDSPFNACVIEKGVTIICENIDLGEIREINFGRETLLRNYIRGSKNRFDVERVCDFKLKGSGCNFKFTLEDNSNKEHEILINGVRSSSKFIEASILSSEVELKITFAVVTFEVVASSEGSVPDIKLKDRVIEVNHKYQIPMGKYDLEFSIPEEMQDTHYLDVNGTEIYEDSRIITLEVNEDTAVPIDLKEAETAMIIIKLDERDSRYINSISDHITATSAKTGISHYPFVEDRKIIFKIPRGSYLAEIAPLEIEENHTKGSDPSDSEEYFIESTFSSTGTPRNEFSVDHGQMLEIPVLIHKQRLFRAIFVLSDSESFDIISNITLEDAEGNIHSGRKEFPYVFFSLFEGSYTARFSTVKKEKASIDVYVDGKAKKEHVFKLVDSNLVIPVDVVKSDWPSLSLKVSNPSNSRARISIDKRPLKAEFLQLEKGRHSISVVLPGNNELFEYEAIIDGKKRLSHEFDMIDNASILVEINRKQKLSSKNNGYNMLEFSANDYYQMLGVAEGASISEIKRAYAITLRSTSGGDSSNVRKAYEVLSDDTLRKKYDSYRKHGKTIKSKMEEARESISEEDTHSALRLVNEVLKLDPDLTEARIIRGACLMNHGDVKHSVEEMEKVILTDPLNPEPWIMCGKAYHKLFDETNNSRFFDKARAKMEVAIDLQPYNSEPHIALAELCISNKQFSAALRHASEAIRADGKVDIHDFEAMFLKVRIHILAGNIEKTESVAKEILKSMPNDKEVREFVAFKFIEFAQAFYELQMFKPAILFTEHAIKFDKSEKLNDFLKHLKLALKVLGEFESFKSDSSIVSSLKSIVAILIQLRFLKLSDSEERKLNDQFKYALESLGNHWKSTIKNSVESTRRSYPGIYSACSEFFSALQREL